MATNIEYANYMKLAQRNFVRRCLLGLLSLGQKSPPAPETFARTAPPKFRKPTGWTTEKLTGILHLVNIAVEYSSFPDVTPYNARLAVLTFA